MGTINDTFDNALTIVEQSRLESCRITYFTNDFNVRLN